MQSHLHSQPHTVQNNWYVQVNGQSYGPYDEQQMRGFCTEGRINEQSIISQSANQGYAPAAQFQSFLQWTGQLQPQQQYQQQPLQLTQAVPSNPQATPLQPRPQQGQILRPISVPQTGVLARQQVSAPTPQDASPTLAPAHNHAEPAQQIATPQHSPVQEAPAQPIAAKTVFIVMAEIRSGNGMGFLQALQSQGIAQRIGDSAWLLKSQVSVEQLRNTLSQTMTGDDRLFLLDSFANKTAWFNIGTNMDARIRDLWDMSQ